ncbi:MAG: DUF2520 domain-containing protein [Thermoleophilia bacterium]|nr:DUF2520 domain-containing protein [Thermoleophilia bacterium]
MEMKPARARCACSIGAGRMARALLAAAREAGLADHGAWSRSSERELADVVDGCDTVFVAVPDDAIPDALAQLAGATLVGDRPLVVVTSGSIALQSLNRRYRRRLRIVRIHPLQVVTPDSPRDVLDGVTCAVTAIDAHDLDDAIELARLLGMRPVQLDDRDAATWHAAATLAANAVTAILADAIELAESTGIDRDDAVDAFASLATAAIGNVRRIGPEAALTGPIARGDRTTIDSHRAAIRDVRPELLDAYDELAARTEALAARAPLATATEVTS